MEQVAFLGTEIEECLINDLIGREGAVLSHAWDERGDSEHIVDEELHEVKEIVSHSDVQRRSEDQIWNLEIQLGLKERCH